ncbi:hypothetical protein [Amycolatopsis sp. NPDC059657]|uniref:hypothetical protein n=1 Tax=Amycolatopsis sp. NPDC059657 TaxID=3346899 RepID=UPI0036718C7D
MNRLGLTLRLRVLEAAAFALLLSIQLPFVLKNFQLLPPVQAAVGMVLLSTQVALELAMFRMTYDRDRSPIWMLVAMGVLTALQLPAIGLGARVGPILFASALLFTLRAPWSLITFGAVVVASIPYDKPPASWKDPALVLILGGQLYVFARVIAYTKHLRDAVPELAESLRVRTRNQVLRQVEGALGRDMAKIVDLGEQAQAELDRDPAAAAREITRLVELAEASAANLRDITGVKENK